MIKPHLAVARERGVFVWRWSPRAGEPGAYSPRGREAEDVLRRWFTAE